MSKNQRTKNNVRPASSWRSAELLNNTVGFKSLLSPGVEKAPLLASLSDNTNVESLNNDYVLCLKKVNKKDPISKTKALQELTTLVKSSTTEEVTMFLQHWARLYPTLTMDLDHKVRECTQICHGAICSRAGRGLARCLHGVSAAWLAAQYDTLSAPAAGAAQCSLKSTFPGPKLAEMLSFCHNDVMDYVMDNVIDNTEVSLQKKDENQDNASQRYALIASGAMRSLAALLREPSTRDQLSARVRVLLSAPRYWSSVSVPTIRTAWLELMTAIMSSYPSLAEEFVSKCAGTVLGVARAAPADLTLWTCLLDLWIHHQDCKVWVDKKKELRNRILELFESGDSVVSRLAPRVLQDVPDHVRDADFYTKTITALRNGLNKKIIITSKIERQLLTQAITDCMRLVSVRHIDDYGLHLVTTLHRDWLEQTLGPAYLGHTRADVIRHSATAAAQLIKHWIKLSQQQNNDRYDQLVRNVWQNITTSILKQIQNLTEDEEAVVNCVEGHVLLLLTLKTQEVRKQKTIRFEGDADTEERHKLPAELAEDPAVSLRYDHNLLTTTELVCAEYFQYAQTKDAVVLSPLIALLKEFDEEQLYKSVARQLEFSNLYELYEGVLRRRMDRAEHGRSLVEVVFLMKKHLTAEEQAALFATFDNLPPPALRECMCYSAREEGQWIRQPERARHVGGIARGACAGDRGDYLALETCCARDRRGELLLHPSSISEAVRETTRALRDESPDTVEAAVRTGLLLLHAPADPALAHHMLRALAAVLLHYDSNVEEFSSQLWEEASLAVRQTASSWSAELLAAVVGDVLDCLFKTKSELNISRIEHTSRVVINLLPALSVSASPDLCLPHIVALKRLALQFDAQQTPALEPLALRHDCITCKLNCPIEDRLITLILSPEFQEQNLCKVDFISFAIKSVFRLLYLRGTVLGPDRGDEDSVSEWSGEVLVDKDMLHEFLQSMHDFAIVSSLNEGFIFWPDYEIIQETHAYLNTLLDEIIPLIPSATSNKVYDALAAKATELGTYWAYARRSYSDKSGIARRTNLVRAAGADAEVSSGDGYFHQMQADNAPDHMYTVWACAMRSFCLSHTHEVSPQPDVMDAILHTYYLHNDVMLYDCDMSSSGWARVAANSMLARAMCVTVEQAGWQTADSHWDFVNISLCSLLCAAAESVRHVHHAKVAMLTHWTLNLLTSVHSFIYSIPSECVRREPAPHIADLVTEWKDVFRPSVMPNLVKILLHVLENSVPDSQMTSSRFAVCASLQRAARALGWAHVSRDVCRAAWVLAAGALCRPAHYAYKYLAADVLRATGELIVEEDERRLATLVAETEEGDVSVLQLSDNLLAMAEPHVLLLRDLVTAILADVSDDASCVVSVAMWSDAHSVVLGYLLLLQAVLDATALPKHHHYIRAYMENKWVESLLTFVMKLLPAPLVERRTDDLPDCYTAYFTEPAPLDLSTRMDASTIERLSCRLCWSAVSGCTGAARWWAGGAAGGGRLPGLLRKYVTPALLARELAEVAALAGPDTQVSVIPSTREVLCRQRIEEERYAELQLICSDAHPLWPPSVRVVGASSHYHPGQWTSVTDIVSQWSRNVRSWVKRSPVCYVCYARLHHASGKMPSVGCRTCRNKFHRGCLDKWFSTSKDTKCPLCRTEF